MINDFLQSVSDRLAAIEPWLRFGGELTVGPATFHASFSLDDLQFQCLVTDEGFYAMALGFSVNFTFSTC